MNENIFDFHRHHVTKEGQVAALALKTVTKEEIEQIFAAYCKGCLGHTTYFDDYIESWWTAWFVLVDLLKFWGDDVSREMRLFILEHAHKTILLEHERSVLAEARTAQALAFVGLKQEALQYINQMRSCPNDLRHKIEYLKKCLENDDLIAAGNVHCGIYPRH